MDFGIIANVALTSTVTLYGIYWLRKRYRYKDTEYRPLTYRYWWMSWAAWMLAWLLIAFKERALGSVKETVLRFDLPILVFDNFNSILLIVVYFAITRGRAFNDRQARALFFRLTASLAIAYGALYGLFLFLGYPKFAYEIHKTCSLCIAVFTPILVGWGFQLRFKTSIVLMIGSLYGFFQPIIYATEFQSNQQEEFSILIKDIRPAVTMVIALLKVAWAVACTKILCSARGSNRNLIERETSQAAQVLTGWWPSVALHATLLVGIYCVLLVMLVLEVGHEKLAPFGTGLGIVTGVFTLWQYVWKVWGLRKH